MTRKARRWQTKGARAYHVSRYGLYTCDRHRARPGRRSGGNARHPVEAVDSAHRTFDATEESRSRDNAYNQAFGLIFSPSKSLPSSRISDT